jgi:hypothetical protein
VATFIRIRRNGATEVVQIHPADLDAAIVLDVEAVP